MLPNPIRIHGMLKAIRKEQEIYSNLLHMYPDICPNNNYTGFLIDELRTYLHLCSMPKFIRNRIMRKFGEVF